jgi:hypothetical protein
MELERIDMFAQTATVRPDAIRTYLPPPRSPWDITMMQNHFGYAATPGLPPNGYATIPAYGAPRYPMPGYPMQQYPFPVPFHTYQSQTLPRFTPPALTAPPLSPTITEMAVSPWRRDIPVPPAVSVLNTERSVVSDFTSTDSTGTNRANWYTTSVVCLSEDNIDEAFQNELIFANYPTHSIGGGQQHERKRVCKIDGCSYKARAIFKEGRWQIQKSETFNVHCHPDGCALDIMNCLSVGLPPDIKADVNDIIRQNPTGATPSNVLDSIQRMAKYSNHPILVDPNLLTLFKGQLRNFLHNRSSRLSNRSNYDETISNDNGVVLVPPSRSCLIDEFQSVIELSAYCRLEATLPKWAPILIEKPTEAEIRERFPGTSDEDVVRSRSCYIFTCLSHIFNMVKFAKQVPDGFCFTMSDGTRQFVNDGSNLIAYSMVIFWKNEKKVFTRSAYPCFYILLPTSGEPASCVKTSLLAVDNFLDRMFGLSLQANYTSLDYARGLTRGYRDFFSGPQKSFAPVYCYFHLKNLFTKNTWTEKHFPNALHRLHIPKIKSDLDLIHQAATEELAQALYYRSEDKWRQLGVDDFVLHFSSTFGPASSQFGWFLASTGLPVLVNTTSPLEGCWSDAKGSNGNKRPITLNVNRQRFFKETVPAILRKDHSRTLTGEKLMDDVPTRPFDISMVVRMLVALYDYKKDVIFDAGQYASTLYPKMMQRGTRQRYFLVNRPQYVGRVATAEDVHRHEQALSGLGYGTSFITKEEMSNAANRFCVVCYNPDFCLPSMTHVCNCRLFKEQWQCPATVVIRECGNGYSGTLREAFLSATESNRPIRRLPARTVGGPEMYSFPRILLTRFIANRGRLDLLECLKWRGINPGSLYKPALLMDPFL